MSSRSYEKGYSLWASPSYPSYLLRRLLFEKRLGNLENFLFDRGYNRGEIQGQFDRARGLDRNTLLDRNQKNQDDTKIPLVLTYHPAFHRVYGILQTCLNALFVDTEHQKLFKEKIFVSFRRAKNFKDTLVRAKVYQPTDEQAEKGTFKCNGRRSCQICALIVEGGHFRILMTRDLLQSPLVLIIATQKMWSTCCNVIAATKNMWAALKPNFANDSMYTSHTFVLMHANTMRAVLAGVKRYHRRVSLGISLAKVIRVFFRLA